MIDPEKREEKRAVRQVRRTVDRVAAASPRGLDWPFAFRAMKDEDEGFIYKNWMAALQAHPPFRTMRYGEFVTQQRKVIDELLKRPGVEVCLAVEKEVGEPKFGWVCYEWRDDIFVLHFIYLRKLYRQKHIATNLLRRCGVNLGKTKIVASSWTKALSYHLLRWNIDFNPFLAWRDTNANHKDPNQRGRVHGVVGHEPKHPPSGRRGARNQGHPR